MNLYLASTYSAKEKMREYAEELRGIGDDVCSGWVFKDQDDGFGPPIDVKRLTREALRDMDDVKKCDALVLFTAGNGVSRGGKHVETGIALALQKDVYVIGERGNVFHYLPHVRHFSTWGDFITYRRICNWHANDIESQ